MKINYKNMYLSLLVFTLLSCSKTKISCPILIGPDNIKLFMSLNSAKKICNGGIKYVTIIQHEEENPITATMPNGNMYLMQGDSMILRVEASDKYYTPPYGDGVNFLMYKGLGNFSYWLGFEKIRGNYYTLDNDSNLQLIGQAENQYRLTQEGESILMTKGMGRNDFYTGDARGGKIYRSIGDSGIEQIGTWDYFWINLEDGTQVPHPVILSKGMNDSDKWCGELDGVIYIQK